MPKRRTTLKNDENNPIIAEEIKVYEKKLRETNNEIVANSVEDILRQDPICLENSDLEDMTERNKNFYEKHLKKFLKLL
jgi:GTPase involved in cell partitioning and DNA repair